MSKVMQAVKEAEAERLSYVETLKQELREELKWMGSVVARWNPSGASSAGHASTTTPAPRNGGDAPAAHAAVAPAWEPVLVVVRQYLQRCEQQVVEEAHAQVRLKAQAAELEQQARRVEQERAVTRQRLEHAAQAAAALEAARQALAAQSDAARACQALAQDLAGAVQEFQANAAAIDRLVQGTSLSADAVASYQQLADALQQCVSQFTSRLSRAVAPQ